MKSFELGIAFQDGRVARWNHDGVLGGRMVEGLADKQCSARVGCVTAGFSPSSPRILRSNA